MSLFRRNTFPYLFVIGMSLFPLLGRLGVPFLRDTFVSWLICFLVLTNIRWCYTHSLERIGVNLKHIKIYFWWVAICAIRGIFVAENYWEYKTLINSTFCLLLPVFVYIFQSPYYLQCTMRLWHKVFLPIFILFGIWVIAVDGYHFYISPVLFFGCFLPIFPAKWRIVYIILLLVMLFGELGARAQMLKAAAIFAIALGLWLKAFVSQKALKLVHWAFYVLPIVLLVLGVTGIYNVFQENSDKYEGEYTAVETRDGETVIVDASADTRTFIYEEVITSAINNEYVIWGRTPARGNDSKFFGALTAEELGTGKYERSMNEVCHPNVFTWTGLIGLLLWCFIYLKASYLALYKSQNIYLKYVGVFIAFRFFLGWIEDMNNFNISGITVWMIIAMGYSQYFRSMSNQEFVSWVKGCLPKF